MFCPACGAAVSDNAAFCRKCGANLRRGQSSAANQPEAARKASISQQPTASSEQRRNAPPTPLVQPKTDPAKKTNKKIDFPGWRIRWILVAIPWLLAVLSSLGTY